MGVFVRVAIFAGPALPWKPLDVIDFFVLIDLLALMALAPLDDAFDEIERWEKLLLNFEELLDLDELDEEPPLDRPAK